MTRLDIIKAIMDGAGISMVAASRALREHIDTAVERDRASRQRREGIAATLLGGLLCSAKMVAPEEQVRRALQHTDILIGEIDK